MLISLLIITLVTLGGAALTYLVNDEERLMWRLAVGNVVGSAVFGLAAFVLSLLFGFNVAIVAVALAITLLPVAVLQKRERRTKFLNDWAKAEGKLQGGNLKRFTGFGYYAFFLVLFCCFSVRRCTRRQQAFSPAVRTISAICHFISARY